jgi:hypothetical protein
VHILSDTRLESCSDWNQYSWCCYCPGDCRRNISCLSTYKCWELLEDSYLQPSTT